MRKNMNQLKVLCFVSLSLASSYVLADCNSSLNTGVQANSAGAKYATVAAEKFLKMKTAASNGETNSKLCDMGRDARMAGWLSIKKYYDARNEFLVAISQCGSPQDAAAAKQSDLNTEAFNTNQKFVKQMDVILAKQCGFLALPDVN